MTIAVILMSGRLSGCITLPRASFTADQQAAASPAGFSHIRYNEDDPALADMLRATLKPDDQGDVNTLAISGGGANGAYGAGLLYGWGKAGTRPQFQLITGISAGAMAAPLAFAGSKWDEQLRQTYLTGRTRNLLQSRGLLSLLTPGLYSKAPLEDLVRAWVTDDLLRAIAAEHAKGRRLLVATTDLDTGQLVVWDMGAIATHPGPDARNLFVQVLVASASVPGVFAPTMIKVQSAGRDFEEMHVDGQADAAFFAIPQAMLLARRPADERRPHHVFVIVNGQLNTAFAVTPVATMPILGRTVEAATKASIRSALITTLEFCRHNGCDLSVSTVPGTLKDDALDFTDAHVQVLFSAGESAAESGHAWTTAAPAISAKPEPAAATPTPP
jgi:Patatin-like phospholipase